MIAGCRTLRRGGSETAVRATGEACRNPKNRLYVMSDNTNEKAEKGSQAATYERNTKRDAKPVSYTHLDVYKRQMYHH